LAFIDITGREERNVYIRLKARQKNCPFLPEYGKGVSQAHTVVMLGDTEEKVTEATETAEASARKKSTKR
jgi:hypothetical protein